MAAVDPTRRRSRVVIIGAGFGGLSAVKQLARAPFDVTVVDRHNYHLFQPLLYQVATAALSPGDIAAPIRGILRRQKNANVILAKVSGVDVARKEVVAEGRRIPFDYLIVATGAEHAYFGNDWASYAPGLKTIDDATYLRRRILLAFERAETEPDTGRAPASSELRRGRRRADRRRDGRRHRRAGEARTRLRFPLHRPAVRADHSARGGAATASVLRSRIVGDGPALARATRRGSPARVRRDRLRLLERLDRARTHARRARSSGPPASKRHRPRNGLRSRAIARAG